MKLLLIYNLNKKWENIGPVLRLCRGNLHNIRTSMADRRTPNHIGPT
jgi:hypothetical protein